MKDFNGELQYKEKTYKLVFNLNVMETIQEAYGSLEEWGALTDGTSAFIFHYSQTTMNVGLQRYAIF